MFFQRTILDSYGVASATNYGHVKVASLSCTTASTICISCNLGDSSCSCCDYYNITSTCPLICLQLSRQNCSDSSCNYIGIRNCTQYPIMLLKCTSSYRSGFSYTPVLISGDSMKLAYVDCEEECTIYALVATLKGLAYN